VGLIQANCFGIESGWNISVLDIWYLILNWVCVDEGKFSSLLLNREKRRRYCVVGDLIFMSFGGVVGRSVAGGW